MARDAVTVTALAANAGTTNPAGTTINAANDIVVNAVGDGGLLVLRVTNTHGTDHPITVKAGTDKSLAPRAGLGDLTVNVPATTGDVLVVLETARFKQSGDVINIDIETNHAGKVSAVKIPKAV